MTTEGEAGRTVLDRIVDAFADRRPTVQAIADAAQDEAFGKTFPTFLDVRRRGSVVLRLLLHERLALRVTSRDGFLEYECRKVDPRRAHPGGPEETFEETMDIARRPDRADFALWASASFDHDGSLRPVDPGFLAAALDAIVDRDDGFVRDFLSAPLVMPNDDMGKRTAIRWAFARRRVRSAIEGFSESLSPDRAVLLRHLFADCASFGVTQVMTLCQGLVVPRPDWQSQALVAFPKLRGLYLVPPGRAMKVQSYLLEIGSGASVQGILESLTAATLRERRPRGAVRRNLARSLARADCVCILRSGATPWSAYSFQFGEEDFVGTIAAYYDLNPTRPVMSDEEMSNAHDFFRKVVRSIEADPVERARILSVLAGEGGRLGQLTPDMSDALGAIRKSIKALVPMTRSTSIEDLNRTEGLAWECMGVLAFPPHRRLAGLSHLAGTWHGTIGDHALKEADIQDEVIARLARESGFGEMAREAFPHVMADPVRIGSIAIRPLRNQVDFLEEGQAQRHCVATYRGAARRAEIVVFGLLGDDGVRSTASYHVGPRGLYLQQHRGRSNGLPPAEHGEAMRGLAAILSRDGDAMARILAEADYRKVIPGEPVFKADLMNDEERRRWGRLHFEVLSPHLDEEDRALGPEGWIRKVMAFRAERLAGMPRPGPIASLWTRVVDWIDEFGCDVTSSLSDR